MKYFDEIKKIINIHNLLSMMQKYEIATYRKHPSYTPAQLCNTHNVVNIASVIWQSTLHSEVWELSHLH
jgi:hypothetical protein